MRQSGGYASFFIFFFFLSDTFFFKKKAKNNFPKILNFFSGRKDISGLDFSPRGSSKYINLKFCNYL